MRTKMTTTTILAAGCLLASPLLLAQVTIADEATMLAAVNAIRAQARTCPGGKAFPAAPPLVKSTSLGIVANTLATTNTAPENFRGLSPHYLAFGSAAVYTGGFLNQSPQVFVAPDVKDYVVNGKVQAVAAPEFWLSNAQTCADLMTAEFTEVGYGVSNKPGYFPTLVILMAAPYSASQTANYKARIFAELNRIRAAGISPATFPGAKCTAGPQPPLKWNDKFEQAAQFHSDDYAAKGIIDKDNSPHKGSAGDMPADRIKRAGCTGGAGENVMFSGHSTLKTPEHFAQAWIYESSGHCSTVMSGPVAGIGIAHSTGLQALPTGPFVTFNVGPDTGCTASTKTAPSGSTTPPPTPVTGGTSCPARSFGVSSNKTWVEFRLPAGDAGKTISIPGGAHAKYVFPACHRAWWSDLTYTCSNGQWQLTAGKMDADGLCHGSPGNSPYVAYGEK